MATPAELAESWTDDFVHHVPTLPADIIVQVCKEIFASPLHQYDLSLTRGHRSQWCDDLSFRKGLPLVSKLWWKPATRGLYEHVVIRRFGQIPALARTLSSKDAGIDFGALVRKITLHECFIFFPDYNVMGEDVRSIFERCVALEELSFQCHPDGTGHISAEGDPDIPVPDFTLGINPVWIVPQIIPGLQARGRTTLRKLDLVSLPARWQRSVAVALYNLILASPLITALTIKNMETPGSELPCLKFLEELCLDIPARDSTAQRDVWTWDLPRVRSFTLLGGWEYPTIILSEAVGRTVTYLHLCYSISCHGLGFDRLPQLCPVLEHLVFYPREYSLEWMSTLLGGSVEPFRRLRYLDLWIRHEDMRSTMWNADEAASLVERARSSFAPALEGARGLFALTLLPYDLPTVYHPSVITRADDTRVVCVRDIWMLQTAWCIHPVGDLWLDDGLWLEDDSGDFTMGSDADDSSESDDDVRPSGIFGCSMNPKCLSHDGRALLPRQ